MIVVLASRNQHKIDELRRMAPGIAWRALPAELPDPPETGSTFVDNALEKARFVHAQLGLPALADDSGLEVDALDGRPGVWSRRYSALGTDSANNLKLLDELAERPDRGGLRRGRYRCVIALCGLDGLEAGLTAAGTCEGRIGESPRGNNGFGYDPLFLPDATPGRTMAELSPAEKDQISHRSAALSALLAELERIGLTLHQPV